MPRSVLQRRLHFVMAGWFPGGEIDHSRYQEVARRHAPDVPVHFLMARIWTCALLLGCRIFSCRWSITPGDFWFGARRSMAAGLPVVVSDWDGYRHTVSDGVDGFPVPTLAPAYSKQGEYLALKHDHVFSPTRLPGAVAQHGRRHRAAAAAIVRLAGGPGLRRAGNAGRQKIQQRFDWPVVARLHHQLYSNWLSGVVLGRGSARKFSTYCVPTPSEISPIYIVGRILRLSLTFFVFVDIRHRLNNHQLDRCW